MPKEKSVSQRRRDRKIEKYLRKLKKLRRRDSDSDDEKASESNSEEKPTEEPDLVDVDEPIQTDLVEVDEPIQPDLEEVDEQNQEELPEDILEALGASREEKTYGEPINSTIIKSFERILYEGIEKDEKEKILKCLKIPENLKALQAPKLNIELLGIMTNNHRIRDSLVEQRQNEMGLATSNIFQVIDILSRKDFNKIEVIKKLGDALKILCNVHQVQTTLRKKLISPLLDKNLNLNLKDNIRGEYLYTKLDDSVKSVSIMKKASTTLAPKRTKNWQSPRPQTQPQRGRAPTRGAYYQPRHQTRPQVKQHINKQGRRSSGTSTSARSRGRYP